MTSKYTVTFKSSAKKSLKKINKVDQVRILKAISALAVNPYPPGIKKIAGGDGEVRLRSGNYRIVYTVENNKLIVEVIAIGHRREVYRGF